MRLSLSLFAVALFAGAQASNVIELTSDNFDSIVGKGKPALVEFFAPWCGHCKKLAPVWEELADAFSHRKGDIIIAKVDADGAGKEVGKKYEVTGYPTLKWFSADGKPEPAETGRDLDTLAAYITGKTGIKSNIKPPPPPSTLIVDAHTFDEIVLDKSKNALVAFTAPWCGHCKNMKPVYEVVAKNFKPDSDCLVINVDADAKVNKDLAAKYGVKSFPTLKFFSKDNKEPVDYDGQRSEEAFTEYLNEKCGTFRAVGGGLTDKAGRHAEFDALVQKFLVATDSARDAIYKEAVQLAASGHATSKHYLRVMDKIVNGTEGYLQKESKRLASILSKPGLSQEKMDEIKTKANILAAFVEKKAEDVKEGAESLVAKASAEL